MRTLSSPAFEAVRSEETGEVMLVFLDLVFPSTTIRVVSDTEETDRMALVQDSASIVESGTYQWTYSGLTNNIYYLEASGGGDPGIAEPDGVYENGTLMTEGGYLPGYWEWDDHDTLGFNTVYVRLTDEVDPDTKPDGYLMAALNHTHLPYKFEIGMPDEADEGIPSVPLTIDNIDAVLIQELMGISEPVDVVMTVALASSPNEIEAGPFNFKMIGAEWNDKTITGKLTFNDVMIEAYPGFRVTPSIAPAAF